MLVVTQSQDELQLILGWYMMPQNWPAEMLLCLQRWKHRPFQALEVGKIGSFHLETTPSFGVALDMGKRYSEFHFIRNPDDFMDEITAFCSGHSTLIFYERVKPK